MLTKAISGRTHLRHLNLGQPFPIFDSGQALPTILPLLPSLHTLFLPGIYLNQPEVQKFAEKLDDVSSLRTLALSIHSGDEETMTRLASAIRRQTTLRRLWIDFGSQAELAPCLLILPQLIGLENLTLGIDTVDPTASQIFVDVLPQLNSLTHLDLGSSVYPIGHSLPPNLVELRINLELLPQRSLTHLANTLHNMPKLNFLVVQYAEAQVTTLTQLLKKLPQLEKLSLIGKFGEGLAPQLSILGSLKQLTINDQNFTNREAQALSRALPNMSSLTKICFKIGTAVNFKEENFLINVLRQLPKLEQVTFLSGGRHDEDVHPNQLIIRNH